MMELSLMESKRLIKCVSCRNEIKAGEPRLLMKINSASINFCYPVCTEKYFSENAIKKAKESGKVKLKEKMSILKEEIKGID